MHLNDLDNLPPNIFNGIIIHSVAAMQPPSHDFKLTDRFNSYRYATLESADSFQEKYHRNATSDT